MLLLKWVPFHPSITGGEPRLRANLPLDLYLVKNFQSKLIGNVDVFVVVLSGESEKELEELCNSNGLKPPSCLHSLSLFRESLFVRH